jgi:hypothetical protein
MAAEFCLRNITSSIHARKYGSYLRNTKRIQGFDVSTIKSEPSGRASKTWVCGRLLAGIAGSNPA